MAKTGRPRKIPKQPPEPSPDAPVDPLPDSDQLRFALVDAARVVARSTLAAMPVLGQREMRRVLDRRGAQLAVVVNVGTGRAELVAAADGEKPLRAALR